MPSERHAFICIRCPRGCEVRFQVDEVGKVQQLDGNACKLGEAYVQNELTDPRRNLTTTVRVNHGVSPLVPVWTEEPIPKGRVLELAGLLRSIVMEAPVYVGQVVLVDPLGLGIDITASGSVEAGPSAA